MKPQHLRAPLALGVSLVLAIAVAALGAVSLLRAVDTFQPLGFAARATGAGWTVFEVTSAATGLEPGDQILLAGGEQPSRLGERLRGSGATDLVVLRDGALAEVAYRRPPLEVDWAYLVLALTGMLYLLIGVYTGLRERRSEAWLFYLWCLASATFYLVTPSSLGDTTGRVLHAAEELARALLPPLTLHLFLVFPRRLPAAAARRAAGLRLTPFLYLPAALLLALQVWLVAGTGRWVAPASAAELLPLLDRASLVHLVAFALAALAVLLLRLARHHEWEERRQLQWIAVGLAVGYLPFLLFYVVPYTAGIGLPRLLTAAAVLPLAFVPLTFSWAILRYKLWDLAVVLRETASTVLTVLLGAGAFALAHLAVVRSVPEDLGLMRSFLSFGSGVVIAGLLLPTRRQVGAALERLQYGRALSKRRALTKLGRELLLEKDLGRLCRSLLDDLLDAVELDTVNLYVVERGDRLVPVVADPRIPAEIDLAELGPDLWTREVEALNGVSLPDGRLGPRQRLFIAGYRYAFPLSVRGGPVGLLVASFRVGDVPLSSDDLELVRQVAGGAALAIENARLLERVHRQLDEVLRLQRFSEGIIESSPAGMAVLDPEGRILSANVAFANLAHCRREELTGTPVAAVLPVEPLPAAGDRLVEVSYCDATGAERHLQLSVAGYDAPSEEQGGEDEDGAALPLRVLVVYDVSDRVAMEKALREKDRMAALGLLAAGVAHEVNTPITGISSYAQMLLADTPTDDPRRELLQKVERQTFRASRIVNNLLDFARKRTDERGPMDLVPVVSEALELLNERRSRRGVKLDLRLPEDGVTVYGNDGELQQVFTNLALNAIDSMERGGTLTVSGEVDGDRARIAVEDTGAGIPAADLERIFEPFYSTKVDRGGTGLGLSISRDIVHRHGGELHVESEPGRGTRFTVELPVQGAGPAPSRTPSTDRGDA